MIYHEGEVRIKQKLLEKVNLHIHPDLLPFIRYDEENKYLSVPPEMRMTVMTTFGQRDKSYDLVLGATGFETEEGEKTRMITPDSLQYLTD